jgi:hypothetical protein
MPSEIPNFNALLERGTRKSRKGSIYTAEERAVLRQYKDEYRSKTTREERLALVKSKILRDIFNYWDGKGVDLNETETYS